MALGNNGNFYGTATFGGTNNDGTVFQVTPGGSLTALVSFNGANGSYPVGALALGNDGNFYGTTSQGGDSNVGTVFRFTTNGVLTTLVSFNGTNGNAPKEGLLLGNDGNFYGTTYSGGSYNFGTVFKVTTNGLLTTLASFSGGNGSGPKGNLILGSDGKFYGATMQGSDGGNNNQATVFQVTSTGILSLVVSLASGSVITQADLTLGNDGRIYGTTDGGGNGYGSVFVLTIPPPPAPVISTYSSQPVVFFPNTGINYTVQMTTNLTSGIWVTVTNGIPISGLIITNASSPAFFRLQ